VDHHWIKIFDSEEALNNNVQPGRAMNIIVRGNKICLANGHAGVFAVSDRCPHNGASLGQGFCNEHNQIVCPMHRYPFDLKTGKAASGLALSVETYPLKIDEKGVFIGIKPKWWEF
jgi:nitrite reductase/ring-hydroxylating ferredoxin subunit